MSNKFLLFIGLGAAALIAILVIVNQVSDPPARPVDPSDPIGWVDEAHRPVIEVTDQTFQAAVIASDRAVLVDFWAAWCGPCQEMAPVVEQFAETYPQAYRVAKLDVDKNPQTAAKYHIDALPTLVVFRNGQEVDRIIGLRSLDDLVAQLTDRP